MAQAACSGRVGAGHQLCSTPAYWGCCRLGTGPCCEGAHVLLQHTHGLNVLGPVAAAGGQARVAFSHFGRVSTCLDFFMPVTLSSKVIAWFVQDNRKQSQQSSIADAMLWLQPGVLQATAAVQDGYM